ncbi:MAG: DNA-binding protein [Ruminococcus flavefaciens]|nr:DNA-binding protein [Ruminococcus flavefaciens]
MDDFLDELTLDDLDGDQYDLAECIGLEMYIKLVRTFAGLPITIPMPKSINKNARNRRIIKEFNGCNAKQLARRYGLSKRRIHEITSYKLKEIKESPIDGQLKMF